MTAASESVGALPPGVRPWRSDTEDAEDRVQPVFLALALVGTLLIHAAVGLLLAHFDEAVIPVEGKIKRGQLLCSGGRRCKAVGWHRPRMDIEASPPPEFDVIQAAVIPRLGLAEEDPKKLPRLMKYEQPEKFEEGVNITEENPPAVKPLRYEPKPKKAQRDRRRKKKPRGLASILGAPDDDDPRKRPTRLEDITGVRDGSVHGSGTKHVEGNKWAGRVTLVLRRNFVVPASIDTKALRKLNVELRITQIGEDGSIAAYEIDRKSGNRAYDMAAKQLVMRFMPAEGGTLRLPRPKKEVLDLVNHRGLVVELKGSLFRR